MYLRRYLGRGCLALFLTALSVCSEVHAADLELFGFELCGISEIASDPAGLFVALQLTSNLRVKLQEDGATTRPLSYAAYLGFPTLLAIPGSHPLERFVRNNAVSASGAIAIHGGTTTDAPVIAFQLLRVPLAERPVIVSHCASDILGSNVAAVEDDIHSQIVALETFSGPNRYVSSKWLWTLELSTSLIDTTSLRGAVDKVATWKPAPSAPPPVIQNPNPRTGDDIPKN